jgi:hypothetical protein
MWHFSMCHHYPMCCPLFPILILSSLHLVIYRHPYLTHTKSNFRNFFVILIQHFIFFTSAFKNFHLKKISCHQTLRRFSRVTNFSRYPLEGIILYDNQNDICSLWDLGLWILTTELFHSHTLAYCRPIHLISIEFQCIDNNPGSPPKTLFPPSIVIILQSLQSLWLRFFLQSIRIVRLKIL